MVATACRPVGVPLGSVYDTFVRSTISPSRTHCDIGGDGNGASCDGTSKRDNDLHLVARGEDRSRNWRGERREELRDKGGMRCSNEHSIA